MDGRRAKWAYEELPIDPQELPETPRKLLEAARRVLERDGFQGLKLEAVSAEAGIAHSLIRYHFGSKAGLVAILMDWLSNETYQSMQRELDSMDPNDAHGRVETVAQGVRHIVLHWQSYRLYLDLVGAGIQDESLRPWIAESFSRQRRMVLRMLGLNSQNSSAEDAAFGAVVIAFCDGIALQYIADPSMRLDDVLSVWDKIMDRMAHHAEPGIRGAALVNAANRDDSEASRPGPACLGDETEGGVCVENGAPDAHSKAMRRRDEQPDPSGPRR